MPDDIHGDEFTVLMCELVDDLAAKLSGAPVLLLCLARSELLERRPGWGEAHGAPPVVLGPLNSGLQDPPGFGSVMRQESTWLVRLSKLHT
mgnify:CR=1 FL=1